MKAGNENETAGEKKVGNRTVGQGGDRGSGVHARENTPLTTDTETVSDDKWSTGNHSVAAVRTGLHT